MLDTIISNNNASYNGGGTWIYSSSFGILRTDYVSNLALNYGGGIFKPFFDDSTLFSYCIGFYNATFEKNVAYVAGAMYFSLAVETDNSGNTITEDCVTFDNLKFVDNSAINGQADEVFLNDSGSN